jgi:co-chaperonin GroES (HSP10)
MSVSVGDNVMYSKDMAGDVIKLGEEKYLLLQEHHLLGVLKNE